MIWGRALLVKLGYNLDRGYRYINELMLGGDIDIGKYTAIFNCIYHIIVFILLFVMVEIIIFFLIGMIPTYAFSALYLTVRPAVFQTKDESIVKCLHLVGHLVSMGFNLFIQCSISITCIRSYLNAVGKTSVLNHIGGLFFYANSIVLGFLLYWFSIRKAEVILDYINTVLAKETGSIVAIILLTLLSIGIEVYRVFKKLKQSKKKDLCLYIYFTILSIAEFMITIWLFIDFALPIICR